MRKHCIQDYILRTLFLTIFAFLFSSQAYSKEFTYQVYAGGIHAVEATFKYKVDQNEAYNASVASRTRGWLGSLVPWEGVFQTKGALKDDNFTPVVHQSISTWQDETEIKTFKFEGDEIVSLTIEEAGKIENREINQDLTKNTTDLLSATLNVMSKIIQTGACNGENDIFDGKRRFTLYFRDQGESVLRESSYNIFSGPARFCTIEIEPKGGKWHDKPRGWLSIQEQGRQKGALPAVWMAKVEGFEYAVPVKIRVKTNYGTLMMHLTDVK